MDKLEYKKRRDRLFEKLETNSVVLISGADECVRNNDCNFEFRQDSDFFYLTGFNEPQSFLILSKNKLGNQFYLFCREKNYQEELWEGYRAGTDGAKKQFGADKSYDINSLHEKVGELLADQEHVYYRMGMDNLVDGAISNWLFQLKKKVRTGIAVPSKFHDVSDLISEMRLIKSEAEIKILRKICHISAMAHKRAMQSALKATFEYQLQAEINYELMKQGSKNVAYNSIVAAGGNACVLHYTQNTDKIKKNELILIDAGGELNNYAADITRTFPQSGTFSFEQKKIYEIVLSAQKAGIECIRPGLVWTKIQETMLNIICQGLLDLGLLEGSLTEVLKDKSYRKFYMHNSGHWLGLDVHDSGSYKENGKWRTLKKGMVLTVEPGIYIADHHEALDAKWHNIGIRIEDDILVTEDGFENLTKDVPREVVDIEALVQNAM